MSTPVGIAALEVSLKQKPFLAALPRISQRGRIGGW
jgi:hypothetical protein